MTDVINVVGTDGHPPVRNPNQSWHMYSKAEVWLGEDGLGKYVANLGDYVKDTAINLDYEVVSVDPVTLIPELREKRPFGLVFDINQQDVLFATIPGPEIDTYRCIINKAVYPYEMCLDPFLVVRGNEVTHIKVFARTNVGLDGDAISRLYDNNGTFISELIPLELADIDGHTNYSTKVVPGFNTIANLDNGDIVTVVHYNSAGTPVSRRGLVVQNSNLIRTANISKRYISDIILKSPFMSETEQNRLNAPLNLNAESLNLTAEVHYTNGEIIELPVDGSKFTLGGIDQLTTFIPDHETYVNLRYLLGPDEVAVSGVSYDGKMMAKEYKLVVTNPNNAYSVKLFGYPVWVGSVLGYTMKWFLCNLDRNIWFDVTSLVKYHLIYGPFDPLAYGLLQRKRVSVNLRDVSQSFKDFEHVQNVEITLRGPGNTTDVPWLVSNSLGNGKPIFGDDVFATRINTTTVNLSSGETTLADWKNKLYIKMGPMVRADESPLVPTHFTVMYGAVEQRHAITDWNVNIDMGVEILRYKNVYVRFLKHTSSGDLELGIIGMSVK